MAKRKVASSVRCPFCKDEGNNMLYCEGIWPGTVTHLAFGNAVELRKYRKEFCEADYSKCRIAQMLERKWEDEQAGKQ